ncbi:MAG: kinase [Desulfobacterales bacterium]|nr:kinase [Desulfobacterales bacterium]
MAEVRNKTSDEYVLVVGGANVDIQGAPSGSMVLHDSNPGRIEISAGGVGRNVAENISRLNMSVKLISAVGADSHGAMLLDETRRPGVDADGVFVFNEESTSTYLSVHDADGELLIAVSRMDILDLLTVEKIMERSDYFKRAALVVLDANLSREVLRYIVETFPDTPVFIDPVSSVKVEKIRDFSGKFHTIKPNRIEAEILTGVSIRDRGSMEKAGDVLLTNGNRRVFISLGVQGIFYKNGDVSGIAPPFPGRVKNVTGAGDAVMAALAYGFLFDYSIEKTARFAAAAAAIAISHPRSTNPGISAEKIRRLMASGGDVK